MRKTQHLLWSRERPADAERLVAVRTATRGRIAVVAALGAASLFAFLQLAGPSSRAGQPSFLRDALGSLDPDAPLVRRPATGVEVKIGRDRFGVESDEAAVALATEAATTGPWQRFDRGVTRSTSFGAETIVVDGQTTEQFLTVDDHQGMRTWRWRIDSKRKPRVGDDRAVGFLPARAQKLA